MSAHEERQRIIRENIPKLIRSLTKFEPTDPNFQLCEQCAWYTIRNHRNLSVNSHEIKRRIDGVVEKFTVANFPQHAEAFTKLCNELINHPLCLNHYEVDVQWAIIEFLLNVSYNPVGSIRRSYSQLQFVNFQSENYCPENDVDYWVKLLKEDCISLEDQQCNLVDSELSDWSESSLDDGKSASSKMKSCDESSNQLSSNRLKACVFDPKLKPPQKDPHFMLFDQSKSEQWLYDNVQHSWWQENESISNVPSDHEAANFCMLWNGYDATLEKSSDKLSITTEYALLREIIWMFQEPTKCKYFRMKMGKLEINDNVSISSTSQDGLKQFLLDFVPYIEKLKELHDFIKDIHDYQLRGQVTNTYDCYASCLNELLKPFYTFLLETEQRIMAQNPLEINTVLQLRYDFDKNLQYLSTLHSIHTCSVLDYRKYPAHICSAHLLSGLFQQFRLAMCPITANLVITLFLSTVKVFCEIIDVWWTEGRLYDWRNEFLVARPTGENDEIVPRLYEKCKEKSFFVPQSISNVIQRDAFLTYLKEHAIQAGYTLNLLYQINKINELKNASSFTDSLYKSFVKAFREEIKKFSNTAKEQCNGLDAEVELALERKNCEGRRPESDQMTPDFLSFDDEFLAMAFECNSSTSDDLNYDECVQREFVSNSGKNPLDIFETLNSISETILPLEDIIVKSFASILKIRISFANSFVTNMYKHEFEILRHLQNMRKVMLLEASDIMQSFYIDLFKQIESGKPWANPFLLTAQLDDILCAKISNVSSLFCIDVTPFKLNTTKVIDAVDEIGISYDVKKPLQKIIAEKNIIAYNEVFRFLLKVKWGLWALENLRFQRKYKTQPPYAQIKMIDLLMRRLEQLRFWILYSIQCIHSHLMTQVLQSMGLKLDEKIMACTTLSEMKSLHESYIETVSNHCFLKPASSNIKSRIDQLLNLIYVLRYEWASCVSEIEDEDISIESEGGPNSDYVLSSQIDAIESTYIRWHGYFANILNNEVYAKNNSYLAGLSAAFNTSMPY